MVYIINEQIPQINSTLSTSRDMHLELINCLNELNRSIYGLPGILCYIAANVGDVIFVLYYRLIVYLNMFPGIALEFFIITLSIKLFDVILLYGSGNAIEKEVFISYFRCINPIF